MNAKNKDAAVSGRGVRKHIPGGMQAHLTSLRLLYGATQAPDGSTFDSLLTDVVNAHRRGLDRPVRLFVGREAIAWARAWCYEHGVGSAMALPTGVPPKSVDWPAISRVAVVWTEPGILPRELAVRLARALKNSGVRFASLPHELDQRNVWLAAPGMGTSQ